MVKIDHLGTERRNEATFGLDTMSVPQAAKLMNAEDHLVADAVEKQLPEIEKVIEATIASLKAGGRLIYLGAGTSGRLGVLDAAECVPTFGVSPDLVVGLIAGGMKAMTVAVEGAEDNAALGRQDLVDLDLKPVDMVVGIAASGRTPYVIGALDYAREVGATTAAVSCNLHAEISKHADIAVEVDNGPEFLTGSTRLKSGTAQKLILNMISTISMIGIGKVYNNLMVDVKPTNEKLVARAKRIIEEATGCPADEAALAFEESGRDVKVAITMVLTGEDAEGAKVRLAKANGFVREAIK